MSSVSALQSCISPRPSQLSHTARCKSQCPAHLAGHCATRFPGIDSHAAWLCCHGVQPSLPPPAHPPSIAVMEQHEPRTFRVCQQPWFRLVPSSIGCAACPAAVVVCGSPVEAGHQACNRRFTPAVQLHRYLCCGCVYLRAPNGFCDAVRAPNADVRAPDVKL